MVALQYKDRAATRSYGNCPGVAFNPHHGSFGSTIRQAVEDHFLNGSSLKKVFVVGKADIGGGGSKFTYQLFGGGGFNVSSRASLIGGYRDLHVNYDKGTFLFDMSLAGPIFGVSFR